MNILIIDTSTSIQLVAAHHDGVTADRTAEAGSSHSITLFGQIESALEELGITIGDIDVIGVGVGPGSFTGIRIAVTTARMLAQLLGAPLVDVHSPLLYAVSGPAGAGDCTAVAFDARKGRVFGALYRATARPLEPETVVPPGDYPLEKLLEAVPAGSGLYLAGDGISRHYGDRPPLPGHTVLGPLLPSGERSCALVSLLYGKNPRFYGDFERVLPFYARKSDAEVIRDIKMNPPDNGK